MDDVYIKSHLKKLLRLMHPDMSIRFYCREEEGYYIFGTKKPFTENKVTRQVAIYLIINPRLFE